MANILDTAINDKEKMILWLTDQDGAIRSKSVKIMHIDDAFKSIASSMQEVIQSKLTPNKILNAFQLQLTRRIHFGLGERIVISVKIKDANHIMIIKPDSLTAEEKAKYDEYVSMCQSLVG